MISAIADHLWQSTLFAAFAGLLTQALRKNRAETRYWLWLSASVKFLIPFSLLVSVGSYVRWPVAPEGAPQVSFAVQQISQPFSTPRGGTPNPAPILIFVIPAVWFCGCSAL